MISLGPLAFHHIHHFTWVYYTTTLPRITFYADDTQLYITFDQMVDNAEEQADAAISNDVLQ